MRRFLGIDYGSRRIGTAQADDETRIATPGKPIEGRNDPTRDARNVTDHGLALGADVFVVGLPLSMDDTDSEQTTVTRKFAAELARLSGKPVELRDERLTSFAADEVMEQVDARARRKHKGLRDGIAAQMILQGYLDDLAGRPDNPSRS